jgi:SAM-dependent methyltransferase
MRRPMFIALQAAHPSGLLGRALAAVMAVETRTFNDAVLARLSPAPKERILEIGFGHGRTLACAAAAQPEARFAGIDHAADMVAIVERRARALVASGRLELATGDSAALPWPDSTFDGVFAVHTIYFWSQAERDLGEIRRVLRPGGRLVLGFRERSPESEAALPSPVYHLRSHDEVASLLRATGFEPEISAGPAPGLWIIVGRTGFALGIVERPPNVVVHVERGTTSALGPPPSIKTV